eukprot:Rmarinus@m.29852
MMCWSFLQFSSLSLESFADVNLNLRCLHEISKFFFSDNGVRKNAPLMVFTHHFFSPLQLWKHLYPVKGRVYVNVMRSVLDHAASYYDFVRWGSKKDAPMYARLPLADMTIEECVRSYSAGNATFGRDCVGFNLQTAFYCGTHPSCFDGSREGLERAKRNIRENYIVVGVMERMEETIYLLEKLVPSHFTNGRKLYSAMTQHNVNKRRKTRTLAPDVERLLREWNVLDLELYDWVNVRMDALLQHCQNNFAPA